MRTLTKQQARQFILSKQGLIGAYRFIGKSGAYEYVRQAVSNMIPLMYAGRMPN